MSESFDVTERILDHDKPSKNGYFVTKRCMVLCFFVVIILLISFALMGAYLKTGKSCQSSNASTTLNPLPTVNTTVAPYGDGPFQKIRLSRDILPENYELHLEVDMGTKEVVGNVSITVSVNKPTKYVIVHAFKFNKLEGVVRNSKSEQMTAKRSFKFIKNQYHVIELENELTVGTYYLDFTFEYYLRENLKGFYWSKYSTKNGEEKFVAATQFEPVDARTAFPCFDEPSFKANFSVTIKQAKEYIALSNMPIKQTKIIGHGLKTEFESSPKMPTYLVVFVICEFTSKTVIANTRDPKGTSMTYYAPTDQIDQIDYAMDVGKKILPYFENYYNVAYPLPKADMIAIPDFAAGAMENWGLITYRTSALLYQKGSSAVSNKHYVAGVVSHELAHQWFGNIVTMDWWSDLWLNEGFASYVEYLGMNHSEPDWKVLDFQVINDIAVGLNLDALVSSHPVYVEVEHPDDISEIFDSISYQKGGSILRMLDEFLGIGVFVKGLNIYLQKHSYANAKTKDLWDSLSEASRIAGDNINVSTIMNTWILQMGFPVVNVEQQKVGSYQLTQSRFLSDPNPDVNNTKYTSPYNYKWYVPFNYMIINATDTYQPKIITAKQLEWMNMTGAGVTTGVNSNTRLVLKGNAGQDGFYRVNYDLKGWNDIIQLLNHSHKIFDVKDRAGLINDAFALANSARLSFNVTLDLLDYIGKDDDYLPWKAASDSISFIKGVFTRTKPATKLLRDYIRGKVSRLYEKYKFGYVSGHIERYLQVLVVSLACGNGYQPCRDKAHELFQDFMKDPVKNPVAGDFRSLVYYYGVYLGGEKEWEFLFNRYMTNQIASEKYKLMFGLSAIQEPWLLTRWMQRSLDDNIVKSQDVSYVFSYVAGSNPIGQYTAWNFMKENWSVIQGRFSKSFFIIRRIFKSVTAGFTNQYELDEMNKFVETKITDAGTAKRIIKQSQEKIQTNIKWLASNEKTIEEWLKRRQNI